MARAQNRVAKGSILKEDEILCRSGCIIYLILGISNLLTSQDLSLKLLNQIPIAYIPCTGLGICSFAHRSFAHLLICSFAQVAHDK